MPLAHEHSGRNRECGHARDHTATRGGGQAQAVMSMPAKPESAAPPVAPKQPGRDGTEMEASSQLTQLALFGTGRRETSARRLSDQGASLAQHRAGANLSYTAAMKISPRCTTRRPRRTTAIPHLRLLSYMVNFLIVFLLSSAGVSAINGQACFVCQPIRS